MPAEPERTVEFAVDDDVALIWLNRPRRLNAVVPELVDELLDALEGAAASHAKVVVLAGRGRAFCAGHDLKAAEPAGDSRARLERLQEVTRRLRALRQPVIAAVHGYAIGAGAEFALGCDLVLAAPDTVLSFPEVGLGLSVTGAASRLLPARLGPAKAKQLLLFGDQLDAAAAQSLGLVNAITAEGELLETALEWANTLASKPVSTVTLAKRAIDNGAETSVDAALELEVTHAMLTEHSSALAHSKAHFRSRVSDSE